MITKKVYIFDSEDDSVTAFVAYNKQQARNMAYKSDQNMGFEYIEITGEVLYRKDDVHSSKIQDLPLGEVEDVQGLKLGIYTYLQDYLHNSPCEDCKKCKGDAYSHKQKILCIECHDNYFQYN